MDNFYVMAIAALVILNGILLYRNINLSETVGEIDVDLEDLIAVVILLDAKVSLMAQVLAVLETGAVPTEADEARFKAKTKRKLEDKYEGIDVEVKGWRE